MLENLTLAALRCVELQIDGRHRGRSDDHTLDFGRLEGALDKAAAQPAIRIREQACTLDTDSAVFGELNLYIDTRSRVGGASLVIHDLVTRTRLRPCGFAAATVLSGGHALRVAQPSSSWSKAARPPSRIPCMIGFSCGSDWAINTAA